MRTLLLLTLLFAAFSPLPAEVIYDSGTHAASCTTSLPDIRDHSLAMTWALSQKDAKKNPLQINIANAAGDTLRLTLNPRRINDPLYDREEFGITLSLNGASEEYEAKIPDSKYLSGGTVAFTVETNSDRYSSPSLTLLSGTSQPTPFFHTPADSPLALTFLSSDAPALTGIDINSPGLTVHRSALRFTPLSSVFTASPLSADEIAEGISNNAPYSGYWVQLDYDTDGSLLRPGGRYTIALIPDASAGYEIYYIDGAAINPGQWRSGMPKGRLTALNPEGIYAVRWIDVNGEPLPSQAEAQFTDSATLTITFPELNSSLRFLRRQ